MRFLRFFWLEWIYLGLSSNRFWFYHLKKGPSILDSYLSNDAFNNKPSRRFLESPIRIDNYIRDSPINFICIAGF
jgi:hypothetical protein